MMTLLECSYERLSDDEDEGRKAVLKRAKQKASCEQCLSQQCTRTSGGGRGAVERGGATAATAAVGAADGSAPSAGQENTSRRLLSQCDIYELGRYDGVRLPIPPRSN